MKNAIKSYTLAAAITVMAAAAIPSYARQKPAPQDEQLAKATEWVTSLNLNDPAKEKRMENLIAWHLTSVRSWHNSHSYTEVPDGINPETGAPLSKLDRQMIVDSSMPDSVHTHLMQGLKKDLDSAQVAEILDKYTIGKVEFTMKGYKAIVPDLTPTEEAAIRKNLEDAREQAIDYKNMKEISAIFEIYKTKCENYLNTHGRNWHQLYKAYYNKIKAEKAAKKKKS